MAYKKNKYSARKTTIDGITFDSAKEATRYKKLKMLESMGAIKELKMQVPFELQPAFRYNGKQIRAIKYVADFTYYAPDKNGNRVYVVEDTKGYRNYEYLIKRKMFLFKFGFEITEV